ncbi:TRAP transporter permease [Aestuariirhabdus litorea]|uniref:TRAP transporter fused permease subunit n=1 Tax=Aestuariirhabdus litorea TaxID=2528527 RepID=A0A3P3VKG7_9GAMM|nr:TRAP transporter fused permease subunit [Aestuariirhabdus litorea]RRJ83225.1 TRAP transporter fused permease subunit [Aestuariirhabdus litorea]RWW93382.1 TRAP transporter fused permease subunit [Endozoicomonadaceae bacterium GTF-13]
MSKDAIDLDPELSDKLRSLELTKRADDSLAGKLVYWIGVLLAVAHIYFNTLGTLSELWVSAIHFGGFALVCALMVPAFTTHSANAGRWTLLLDSLLGLAALACAAYLIGFEDALYDRGVRFVTSDWIASAAAIFIALEMVRRSTGWFIPVMTVLALTYVFWWGPYIDGVFGFAGLSLETVMFRSFFSPEGMFGSIARISWTYVFMFILFGAFLVKSGAGDFIIELSRCAAGRFVGGPGFVAVLGSGLMGSVSGSAVANTVSTGVITIPLMRRAGFPARFSAGVEAAASTGGQLMPPVMGAGAFIMASYTQIPYVQIIAIAALPALLYFMSVGFFVRVEAQRSHADSVEIETRPLREVMKEGWHFALPLVVLVGMLIKGFTPTYAAGVAILSVIASSWLSKQPMGPRDVLDSLAQGSKNMATTAMLLVTVGLVVNVVAMTGVGNTFSLMVTDWAGGSLLITIVLVALASLILGMGLPVTASYIVLATLSAPALYNLMAEQQLLQLIADGQLPEMARSIFMLVDMEKAALLAQPMPMAEAQALLALVPPDFKGQLLEMAVDPALLSMLLLSAHMIIFWLSQDSNVTPPVCLTAFAAAAIARTPAMATGLTAWKVAKGLYVVPLLFAYTPLIGGSWEEVITVFIFSLFGLYAFVGLMEGYLEGPINLALRGLCGVAALALMWPHGLLLLNLGGLALFVALFWWSRRRRAALVASAG